ncbi:hypothetical protein EHZ19_28660 [Paraburkholderia bannensis]|nr:hypothetical protein [Paraburkholderia bannensis]RQM44421.1 hypothetical protein EHZ19_28660 [Paraburkholderia bannensis]
MSGNVYDYGIHRNLSPSELFFLVFLDEASQQMGIDDLVDVAAIIVGWLRISANVITHSDGS